jgi:hypothetical protein
VAGRYLSAVADCRGRAWIEQQLRISLRCRFCRATLRSAPGPLSTQKAADKETAIGPQAADNRLSRGPERFRIEGLSTSHSGVAAEKLARGLVAETGERASLRQRARRCAIFMSVNDRNEREVLLDPRLLIGLTVAPLDVGLPAATAAVSRGY